MRRGQKNKKERQFFMFSSIKLKLTSGILLLPFLLQSFPGAALGYDVLGRLRNFVSTQVKTSDEIINPNKLKIKESFQKAADWYEGKWLGGLSLLESKTGLSEENNKAYKALKSYNLFNLGFNAGVVNCAGSLAAETYTLVAKIPTAPERIVKFTFDYREDPDKYHAMVTDTALAVAGVAMNAIPLLEQGKDAYLDAAKDPLKFGHINGEITAFAGSFLIGGGQVKALSSAQRLEKAAGVASSAKKAEKIAGTASSATPIISSPLDALTKGWKNWLNGRTTFVTAAKDGSLPANKEIPLVITGYNQKAYNLGVVEKGTPKLYDEIDLRPEDLRALKSIDEIWDKQWEYQELLFSRTVIFSFI
jgi:hypothetical protein